MRALQRSARWLRSRFGSGALILGYHRIAGEDWDPFSLSVAPGHFAEHLDVLRRHARPLSVGQLVRGIEHGRLPPASVAVTFDDGYADNLSRAKPLLEGYGIPATMFVTTAHLGSEFWWDRLARVLAPGTTLPETIRMSIGATHHAWVAPPADDVGARRRLLMSVYDRLQPLAHSVIERIVNELADTVSGTAPEHRVLTDDELLALAAGEGVEIGAHGQTHSPLALLPVADQESEITQSKMVLEQLLGRPAPGFSYPHGSVSVHTIALVRRSGFAFACASEADVTSLRSNRFALPRFWVPDWDGRAFSRWLLRWIRR